MNILHLKNFPIFQQLQLEEALLRLDTRNFCIINEGSPPAIVMGISGKPEELINFENLGKNPIPIIKRFSGGGTVIVDEETIFISFLCQKDLHDFAPYPEPIMRWTEEIYKEALDISDFSLRENDYVIGERKFGGNAQYLRKDRWLHHTTLLWDYKKE
ncbi:MAG: Lipoate-protein ligase LplJ, partial [Chlamydiae bacterium]|nr:Lipoate-protein ligase LplJ [Chlamydiota bacterium]